MGHGLRSATFLMCMNGRRVSLMILDGVAPASTTMAATLGMVASVAIAEVAEQGSWGAIRLIWMRLDRAGDSDRGRAPQTGMRVAADVTLHPLAIAPVATTGSATGHPSVHLISRRTTASPDMATEARTTASGRASATAPGANERRIGSATAARAPTLLAEQSASSAHLSTQRRPCARPNLANGRNLHPAATAHACVSRLGQQVWDSQECGSSSISGGAKRRCRAPSPDRQGTARCNGRGGFVRRVHDLWTGVLSPRARTPTLTARGHTPEEANPNSAISPKLPISQIWPSPKLSRVGSACR